MQGLPDEDFLWEEEASWAYLDTAADVCVCVCVCVLSSKWTVLQVYCDAVVSTLFLDTRDILMHWFNSAGQENKWEYSP
jgi:hypothetical protein